jgi:hypothetical protein
MEKVVHSQQQTDIFARLRPRSPLYQSWQTSRQDPFATNSALLQALDMRARGLGRLWLALVVLRLGNAWLVQTQFVPDEYWQGPEIAHLLSFCTGHRTWEWYLAIRSVLHPAILALFVQIFSAVGCSSSACVIWAYKLPHILLAASADLALYHFAIKCSGSRRFGALALVLQLLSWFQTYACTRTLSNSLEASLLIISLALWPSPQHAPTWQKWAAFLAASIAVIARPPSAVFFGALALLTLTLSDLVRAAFTGITTLTITTIFLDAPFFGRWELPMANFFHQNLVLDVASAYGTHPTLWYLYAGLPTILLTFYPLTLIGLHTVVRARWQQVQKTGVIREQASAESLQQTSLSSSTWSSSQRNSITRDIASLASSDLLRAALLAGLVYLTVLSATPHKELRFLQPFLPLTHLLSAIAISRLSDINHEHESTTGGASGGAESRRHRMGRRRWSARRLLIVLALTQAPVALYTCLIHNRGPLDAVDYLSHRLPAIDGCGHTQGRQGKAPSAVSTQPARESYPSSSSSSSSSPAASPQLFPKYDTQDTPHILFLTPCHATPLHSHIHARMSVTFLHCETVLSPAADGPDATEFFSDPLQWLERQEREFWSHPARNHDSDEATRVQQAKSFTQPETQRLLHARPKPEYIVLFSHLADTLQMWLSEHGYHLSAQFFHTHFPESRTGTHICVYELNAGT